MYNYEDFLKANYFRGIYNNEDTLENIEEGYAKGNAFKNLYVPYKDYKVKRITPRNEKEQLLLRLNEVCFYAHELNLLLDVNPDNKELLQKFNEYRNMSNDLLNQYESLYGPITMSSNSLNSYPFAWSTTPFPWEKGSVK